jgi:hypothetical protein
MDKFLIKITAVILAAVLVLAGCNNPAGSPEITTTGPDTTALAAAIEAAKTARDSVRAVAEGEGAADVPLGLRWASPEQINALTTKILAAETAKAGATTQAVVDAAVSALNTAVGLFNAAVDGNGTGTSITGLTEVEFEALIAQAEAAAEAAEAGEGVTISTDGKDVPPSGFWITQAALAALNTAITTAKEASFSPETPEAYTNLAAALEVFGVAKQEGVSTTEKKTELNEVIISAEAATNDVEIALNSASATLGSEWVTQAQWDALNGPYTTAGAAYENADATWNEVNDALSALSSAIGVFTQAKTDNGPGEGTATSPLTISGLSAIYDDGDTVRISLYQDKDALGRASGYITSGDAVVTGGSVTFDPGAVAIGGSYYVGFTAEKYFFFISRERINFSGSSVSQNYSDFKGLIYSFRLGDEGFESGTLDGFFLAMDETSYSTFRAEMEEDFKEDIDSKLYPLVDYTLYKNPALTQVFNGSDPVNADTVIYCKNPLDSDYVGAQIGQITGSLTLTNIPPSSELREVYIEAGNKNVWGAQGVIDVSNAGLINWTIPLYEYDIRSGAWDSIMGSQEVYFSLYVRLGGNGDGYDISLGNRFLNMSNKENIIAGDFGEVSLGTITLSGTISLNVIGAPVSSVEIYVSTQQDGIINSTELDMPLSATLWSVVVPVFESETEVKIGISGRDSNDNQVFWKNDVETISGVSNANVPGIEFDLETLNFITLSGTINVKYNNNLVPHVYISTSEGGGSAQLNAPGPNAPWTLFMEAPGSQKTIIFSLYGQDSSWNTLFYRNFLSPTTVHNTSVPGIVIDVENITIGGGQLDAPNVDTHRDEPMPNSIKLSWDEVAGASFYNIYRSTSQYGTYSLEGTSITGSFADTGLLSNTTYFYQVAAVASDGGEGPRSYPWYYGITGVPAPTGLVVMGSTTTSISLSWDAIDDVSSYRVYRSTNVNGAYEPKAWPSSPSCTNSGLSSGIVYYYKVSAMDSYNREGPQSSVVSGAVTGSANVLFLSNAPAFYNVVVTSASLNTTSTYTGVASDDANLKAMGTGSTGPAALNWSQPAYRTGTYDVLVSTGTVTKYKHDVDFSDGSASLDWNTVLEANGGFVINGLPTKAYTVYAVTGNPSTYVEATDLTGSAVGLGSIASGSTTVVWTKIPPTGTAYTLLLRLSDALTTMYKAAGLTITDGGGTATYGVFSLLQ